MPLFSQTVSSSRSLLSFRSRPLRGLDCRSDYTTRQSESFPLRDLPTLGGLLLFFTAFSVFVPPPPLLVRDHIFNFDGLLFPAPTENPPPPRGRTVTSVQVPFRGFRSVPPTPPHTNLITLLTRRSGHPYPLLRLLVLLKRMIDTGSHGSGGSQNLPFWLRRLLLRRLSAREMPRGISCIPHISSPVL